MNGPAKAFDPSTALLLTGAGFSLPCGGYLAPEMWAIIFSQPEIRRSAYLRKCMLDEMNFEAVYEAVITSSTCDPEDKRGLTQAISRSYKQMHEKMHRTPIADIRALCTAFMAPLTSQNPHKCGFIFTLNQDLLVEMSFGRTGIVLPGVPAHELGEAVILPNDAIVTSLAGQFWSTPQRMALYVKLHGSFEWMKSSGDPALVIGTNKGPLLKNEPLLNWYLQLFHTMLHEPDRRLLVIGYSFRDEHIDSVIVSAARTARLKLIVISPKNPEQFKADLQGVSGSKASYIPHGDEIWNALYGYYCGGARDFCHPNPTRQLQQVFSDLGL